MSNHLLQRLPDEPRPGNNLTLGSYKATILHWCIIRVMGGFLLRRDDKGVRFIPHQIEDNSGIGRSITSGDVNGDGTVNIMIANKQSLILYLQERDK